MALVWLALIVWAMLGTPIAVATLALHWMARRRAQRGWRSLPLLVLLLLAGCRYVTNVYVADGGPLSGADIATVDMDKMIATTDMAPTVVSDDMLQSMMPSDMATSPDLAPMCQARASTCGGGEGQCCAGLTCAGDNSLPNDAGDVLEHCCVSAVGPASAGCDPTTQLGCCLQASPNAAVYCQNQNGVGICCRANIGDVCAQDSDCCLYGVTNAHVYCVNNACWIPTP